MTVKDFRKASTFDYINIVVDGELVETIDFDSNICESDERVIESINPMKCIYLRGIELEVK